MEDYFSQLVPTTWKCGIDVSNKVIKWKHKISPTTWIKFTIC